MRSERLRMLERLGLNVPIFVIVDDLDYSLSTKFRKKCAVRFDKLIPSNSFKEVLKGLKTKEIIIESGEPPFIPHMSPCEAYLLFNSLKRMGASFKAHVTDVTVKDSVGAGMTLNIDGEIIVEATTRGTVREISRKGKVDIRARYTCNKLTIDSPLDDLLGYCMFKSAEVASNFHNVLIEWSCHRGKWGVRGDHIIIWEMYKVRSRDSSY